MTLERFTAIVEAYGADPVRWPALERADALDLARSDIDATAPILKRGAALDQVLAG